MELWRYDRPITQLGGRYTLIRPLLGGNMADVCVAWDERDHHEVAIKVIKPELFDPKMLQRFLREGKIIASLDHPHIIHMYGDGVREETFTNPDPKSATECRVPYIVMEYVKGGDLKKRLIRGQAYPLNEIVRIFGQLCLAVQYAHDRNVIHRDIKPGNILFREHPLKGDQVVLSDFGLALLADDTHYSFPEAGTPVYMAPEQRQGKPQKASDIFSLGVVLYQLCTGHLPSPSQTLKKPTELNAKLPPALDDVILRSLSNDPSLRFASASLFWQAIQGAVRQAPHPPRSQADTVEKRLSNRAQSVSPSSPAPRQSIPSKLPNTPPATPIDPRPVAPNAAPPIPQSTGKTTKVLPSSANVGSVTPALPPPVPVKPPAGPSINTGKMPVATARPNNSTGKMPVAPAHPNNNTGKTPVAPARPNNSRDKTPAAPMRSTLNTGKTPAITTRTPDVNNTFTPAGSISAISQGWPPPGAGSSRRTPPANHNRRRMLIVALVILVLFVVGGLIASAKSYTPPAPGFTSSVPPATITMTAANKTVQDSYVLPSVDGNSNIANRQVGVRQLTSTKTATDTATATGQGKTIARNATGTLTFKNAGSSFDLGANTSFPGPNGVTVANDQFVTIPAGNVAAGTFGVITVNAHAVPLGTAGNTNGVISNQACCRADSTIIIATSSTFTGGVDSKTYTFLQESDVAKAAANVHPDATALRSDAQSDINGHIQQPGQKLVNPINCDDPKTATDAPIGDQGIAKAVTSAKVTVSVTCNAQVYDANAVQTIAQNALKQKVSKDPTLVGYVLVGNIITQVQPLDGPITFSVTAKGVWSYQWTDANKQKLLAKIKGKTKAQAQAILNKDPGIDQETKAKIEIDNGGTTLPNDAKQITIVVNTVKGL